jgi:hypothetical protein
MHYGGLCFDLFVPPLSPGAGSLATHLHYLIPFGDFVEHIRPGTTTTMGVSGSSSSSMTSGSSRLSVTTQA